jgi:RHS repeat-associated protein
VSSLIRREFEDAVKAVKVKSAQDCLLDARMVSGVTRLTTTLGYAPGAAGISTASKRIASLTNTGRSAISYAYDVNGNISVITQAADRIEYYYDGLSQLKRENYSVGSTSYTRVYTYDTGGNIQSIQNHPYTMGNGTLGTPLSTDTYTYDTTWRDKLTAYNGQSISYDAIGNPTSYLGATLTWTMGRQLESYAKAGTNVQYTYNESGLRTRKVVNGTATTYHLVGDQVTMEQTGTQTPIRYAYDAAGQLFLIQYDGQNYFYARNAQGDIIGMVDANGNWVLEYKYDAWGKLLSTTGTLANTLGVANPYRYRGYRYDTETGLYYLQSKYYDSMTGRFLTRMSSKP